MLDILHYNAEAVKHPPSRLALGLRGGAKVRSVIACSHRPPCPGCPRLGDSEMAGAPRALLEAFAEEHGVPELGVVRGPETGFRHRARLAVRGRARSPKIGIFETGSHRIVDIPRCLVHHDLVNDVATELRRAMIATGSSPYSDDAHRGLVRYVQVVVERRSRTAQVVVVTNDDSPRTSQRLMETLAERLGPRLHSLFWNGNPHRTNTILGSLWEPLKGPEATEELIGGARVFFPPGAFGQSNLALADAVVASVHRCVPEGASVLELYAGVGPIGLGLAPRSRRVTFNEVAPASLRGLALGMDALPEEARTRTDVVAGSAAGAVSRIREADLVIVDPPRKGLEAAVRTALLETPPGGLVYVSCGLSSFLEDARALLETSVFRLTELTAFDLFPHTEHVETVARFERAPR
jgi:23S rRNA (uracil1939-C5)-methyltransferase